MHPRPPRPARSAADVMGRVGLPAPIADLARRRWDAVVVGAGHNGMAAAAYLAMAGQQVLVVEARERIGGACTLEEPWPGYRVSPCAYLAGLLHPLVIDELDLVARGFRWTAADGGMFVPFPDGSSVQLWSDRERLVAELRWFAPADVDGYLALQDLVSRTAAALRPQGHEDLWISDAPTREQVHARLGGDPDMHGLVFDWSMAELLDRHLTDERLVLALLGQGVIGTDASPFDPGTASIHLHHASGAVDRDRPGTWGFVQGGMGMVSFLIHDAAVEAGAVIAAGVPVARILPGEGVLLEDGTRINAPTVLCNADPQVATRLLAEDADPGWAAAVDAVPIRGCTVKISLALDRPPTFPSRPHPAGGTGLLPHHRAQINTPLTREEWADSFAAARAGRLPDLVWTEDYLQTAYDASIAPDGRHLLSVFAQYVPHTFADGRSWDDARGDVARVVIDSIARVTEGFEECIVEMEVMGPPDIERKVGLTGGHIFQGECLPAHMWDRRLTTRTPMAGVYLCGAGTYPGGSVMAINGRNAAMAVLADLGLPHG